MFIIIIIILLLLLLSGMLNHGSGLSRLCRFQLTSFLSKSGLLIKFLRLDISELRNYFTKIKLTTSCSKWTGPYNNRRIKYNTIR